MKQSIEEVIIGPQVLKDAEKLYNENSEELEKYLKVIPGAVTPFALLNDTTKKVHFLMDGKIGGVDFLNFHPLVNTATVTLSKNDLIDKFIGTYLHRTPRFVHLIE